jgi:hypothetical protein
VTVNGMKAKVSLKYQFGEQFNQENGIRKKKKHAMELGLSCEVNNCSAKQEISRLLYLNPIPIL